MQYGIIVNAGDPRTMADLAAEAEAAGWDGVFHFDGVGFAGIELYDPWVVLAAMAMRTERVTLGLIVTPPSRRRPWKLAREAMSVDRLSNGRLVLPVGLGALDDPAFGNVGEATDARTRAELLDEALAILDGLWSGRPFAFEGRHYRFGAMTFLPTPVQRPRIPVWVVGAWPRERSMRRALRWDGVIAQGVDTPEALAELVVWVGRERNAQDAEAAGPPGARAAEGIPQEATASNGADDTRGPGHPGPFEIVSEGSTPADDPAAAREIVRPYLEAGATWWLDADWRGATVDSVRARIAAGPPRVD